MSCLVWIITSTPNRSFYHHTANWVRVLSGEIPCLFPSGWTQPQFIWNVSVIFILQCASRLSALRDSSVITLDRQYSACVGLLIVRAKEKRFVAEVIYFICLSLWISMEDVFSLTHSDLCTVYALREPNQCFYSTHSIILYTLSLHLQKQLGNWRHLEDPMRITHQEIAGEMKAT